MVYTPQQGLADVLDQLPRRLLYALWSNSLFFFDDQSASGEVHGWHAALRAPWRSFFAWSEVKGLFCAAHGYSVIDVSEYKMNPPRRSSSFHEVWAPMFAQFLYQPTEKVAKLMAPTLQQVPHNHLLAGVHYRSHYFNLKG